jgi:hypothetical protein
MKIDFDRLETQEDEQSLDKPLMSSDLDAIPILSALGLGELRCTQLSIDVEQNHILTFTGTFEIDVRQLRDLVEALRPFSTQKV